MAFMNADRKEELAPGVRAVLKKYNLKGTLRIRNNTTIVLTLRSGPIDFGNECLQVNIFWIHEIYGYTVAAQVLSELTDALNEGNYDNSMPQCDYFDVGWHVHLKIGEYDKPYLLTEIA